MKADTAIRPGMVFTLIRSGDTYIVRKDKAFGRVELFCRARCRFGSATKKELRDTNVWRKI